jgi:hypothetical protein
VERDRTDAPLTPGERAPADDGGDDSGAESKTVIPPRSEATEPPEPRPDDEVDEWGYESFPASDPPQH